jgi:hypothetical protein
MICDQIFNYKFDLFVGSADGDPVSGVHLQRQALEHSDQPGRRHTPDQG